MYVLFIHRFFLFDPTAFPLCFDCTVHFQLNEDLSTDALLHDSEIEFDSGSLSLTFSASLEYIGLSADGNFDDEFNLGLMYIDVFLWTI